MPDPFTPTPEQLLSQNEWVRRLAASLVASAHDADDVAQETWRVALEHPPRHAANLRHWLALAARNVARTLGARERRHSERHGRELPPELAPSAAELVERAQLQRRVVDAVLALAEPYRAALLYRFFEDLSTSTIAARVGVPVETMRTWLKRGLAQLRERLHDEFAEEERDWTRALAPLIGTGTLLMTKSKLAVAAVVLIAGVVTWQLVATSRPDRPELVAHTPTIPAASASAAPEPEPAIAAARADETARPDDAPTAPLIALPVDREPALIGTVRTADGEPVPDATILLGRSKAYGFKSLENLLASFRTLVAPTRAEDDPPQLARSDEAGLFTFDAVKAGTFAISAVRDDLGVAWQPRVDVVAGNPAIVELVLEPGVVITGRVFRPDGSPCAGAQLEIGAFVGDDERTPGDGRKLGTLLADASGEYQTIALPYTAFEVRAEPPEPTRAREAMPASSGVVAVLPSERTRRIDVTLAPVVTVTGKLRLADGGPVAERLRATFTPEELTGKVEGTFGVIGVTEDPVASFRGLMADPRSALGNTYMNGGRRPHKITWISGTCDVDAATYTLRLVEPGITHLAAIARKTLLAAAAIPPTFEGPDLVLDLAGLPPPLSRGRIRVRVVDDATDRPIGGGRVAAEHYWRDGDNTTQMFELFEVSPDGIAEADVRSGELTVTADRDGFVSTSDTIVLREGAREERTLRLLLATRKIHGHVVAAAPNSLREPQLRLYRESGGAWSALPIGAAAIDEHGRFEVAHAPDGPLVVVVSATDFAPAVATTTAIGDAELEFTLEPGLPVTLSALPRDTREIGFARYRVVDERRIPVVDDLACDQGNTHDSTRWSLRLMPGLYQVEAYAVDYEPATAALRVPEQSSLELGMRPLQR